MAILGIAVWVVQYLKRLGYPRLFNEAGKRSRIFRGEQVGA